jgi:lysophospholipase L1-like esterase
MGAGVAYLVLPCVRDPSGNAIGDARDTYRAHLREAARAADAPLADTPPRFVRGDARALFFDDVHPTPEGHALVAAALVEALTPWAERR